MRILVVVLLAACGGKSDDKPEVVESSNEVPSTPSPGFEQLHVDVNGAQVPMHRAFVKRVSPDHWRIQVGDRGGSCEQLLSGVTPVEAGSTSFVATVRKLVARDGFEASFVTDFYFNGTESHTAAGTPAKLTGATDKGGKVEVDFSELVHIDGATKVKIAGVVTAEACGDQPADGIGIPKATHLSSATVTIAGKQLPLRGAILRGNDILLSTGPKDCSPGTPFAQLVVENTGGEWKLGGTWIGGTDDNKADMKGVVFNVGKGGTSPDGPIAPVELKGAGTISSFKLEFSGKIEALDCPTE